MSEPVYLDYNATTPVAPEVLDAMLPFLRDQFGNPSSTHLLGRRAAQAVGEARERVAILIGAQPQEIVFTGCATESNNLALLGVARAMPPGKRHLVVSAVEHPAVLAPARHLREQGWGLSIVPVDGTGRVSPQAVAEALRDDTALVSVMHANNEVGTLQPLEEIAQLTRQRGVLLHTDAAQSAGKVALDVNAFGVDLLTLAGHKFYAPKGVGALYVRHGTPIRAVLFGADQEHGLRPGTENVAAIVGLGVAAELAGRDLPRAAADLRERRDQLHAMLVRGVPGSRSMATRSTDCPTRCTSPSPASADVRCCRQPATAWPRRSARRATRSTTPSAACSPQWGWMHRAHSAPCVCRWGA